MFDPSKYGAVPVSQDQQGNTPTFSHTVTPITPNENKSSLGQSLLSGIASLTGGATLVKGAVVGATAGKTIEATNLNSQTVNQMIDEAKKLPLGNPRRTELLKQAQAMAGQNSSQIGELLKEIPTSKEVAADAVRLATTIGSAGIGPAKAGTAGMRIAETAGKVAVPSAIAGGAEAFGKGKPLKDILKESAVSGAVGGTIGGLGQAAVEVSRILSSPKVQESLYNRALGVTKKTVEKGKSPAEMLIKEGIGGTKSGMLEQVQTLANDQESQIKTILENNPTKFKSKDIISQITEKLQEQFGNALGPDDIKAITENLPINALKTKPRISASDLNSLRSTIDNKFLGNTKWMGDSTAEKVVALKTASNVMRQLVQGTDEALPAAFSKWAKAITAVRSLNSELAKPHIMTNLLELLISGAIGAGTGTSPSSGVLNTLGTFAAFKAGTSAPVLTGLARGLNLASEAGGGVASQGIRELVKTLIPGISAELTQ